MFGAIIGDVIGSRFEFDNCKSKEFDLFDRECDFTDDTVMTLAVAKTLTAFDTVTDLRLDRLDFILDSGAFEDYREIMADYLRDENLFLRANEAHDDPRLLLALVNFASEKTEPLKDVLDWVETIKKVDLEENGHLLRGAAKELVKQIQNVKDLPDYASYDYRECPLCKAGKKLDALINGFGYSKL